MTRSSPAVRPAFRKLAIVAFIVLLPFVLYTAWDYYEFARMDRLTREIDPQNGLVRSPGVTLSPEEADAERFYRAASVLAGISSPFSPGLQARRNRLAAAARSDAWSADSLTDLRVESEENAQAIDLAKRAAVLQYKQFAPGTSFNYQWAGLIDLQRILGRAAIGAALAGDGKGAVDMLYAEARLARTFDDGTTTVFQWKGEDLVQVLERLKGAPENFAMLARAIGDVDEAYDKGQANSLEGLTRRRIGLSRLYSIGPSPFLDLLGRPFVAHMLNAELAVMVDMLPASRASWPQRIDRLIAVGRPFGSVPKSITPRDYVEGSAYYMASSIAAFRCARLSLALDRYRRDHGQLPATVDALVPRYLPAPLVDPFSGHSLLFKAQADGFIAYSVGVNRIDDGGGISSEPAYMFPKVYPQDVGVRVRYQR